jgi:predicted MFS family arabinose efflux permease
LGGVLIDASSYPSIFFAVGAIAAAGAVAARFAVPESAERAGGRVDVRGAVVLSIGVALPLLAIAEGNRWGWAAPRTLGLLAGGMVILSAWVALERRTTEPLIDIPTLLRPQVLVTNVATLLIGFGMVTVFVLTPQLVQEPVSTGYGLGAGATTAGLVLLPGALAMLLLGPVSGALGTRVGNKVPLAAGCLLTSIGMVLLAAGHRTIPVLVVFGLVALAGVGLAFAAMPNLIVVAVPSAQTGEATGINALVRLAGAALGAQVAAAVLAASAVGGVAQERGYTTAFLVGAGGALLGAVAAILVPASGGRRHRRAVEPAGAVAPDEAPAPAGHAVPRT